MTSGPWMSSGDFGQNILMCYNTQGAQMMVGRVGGPAGDDCDSVSRSMAVVMSRWISSARSFMAPDSGPDQSASLTAAELMQVDQPSPTETVTVARATINDRSEYSSISRMMRLG